MSSLKRRQLLGLGVAAAVVLAAPGDVRAEGTGGIVGRILDGGGAPVSGAPVVISSALLPDGELALDADDGGGFAVGQLDAGFYDVNVEIDGFRRGSVRDILVASGQTARVEIQLEARGSSNGGY